MHERFVEPSKKAADIVTRSFDSAEDVIKLLRGVVKRV
jgi:uridine kinase